jgi:hypothetical protein
MSETRNTTGQLREVTAPTRGSGPVQCCGGHRARCLFGEPHHWGTWYEDGKLQRTASTFYCHRCGGVCTAEEDGQPEPVSTPDGMRECRFHGTVPDDHAPCRRPGESGMEFTDRMLGYTRDV